MKFFKLIPRVGAALAFLVASSAAVATTAPQAANAAVFVGVGVGVGGVHVGYSNYPRWRWGGRAWVRSGYFYGRPGYAGAFYVGYAPPVAPPVWAGYYAPYYGPAYPYYRVGFYHPYFHGYSGYRGYYGYHGYAGYHAYGGYRGGGYRGGYRR